ncbi:MAG TPA: FKBP-type peptidyl-prolyl cis-trans isomerase [Solirubrobacteraceae bacterium]|nr:FKBP-type peptidyl-prolyl cis-trans isomerase [Solirubrobacteraceae bacterium]
MPRLRLIALPAFVAASLALSACGGDAQESAADRYARTAEQQARTQTTPTQAEAAPTATKITPTAGERDLSKKPRIPPSTGEAPKELKVEDLIEGKGAAAKNGDTVSVEYVGVLFENNKEFDSSWRPGREPLEVTLGEGQVISGWEQGLLGMKVGGRRKLTIPPDQAYGAQGQPPSIPGNATLVFEIDLKKIA